VKEASASPDELKVAVGPMIGTCHYPVGEDVAEQFISQFGPQVVTEFSHHPHLDLYAAIAIDLLRAGVTEHNLGARPPSTFTDPCWSSYRRDGTGAGGMLAFFTLN
jgi:copper oxidase (laccase) domain-containing protein